MVIAYIRVSTNKQHTENQKAEIERYAKLHDFVIDKWVAETVSGKRDVNKRKLSILLKKLKKGDMIIVTELSRLSRTLTEIMTILNTLIAKGVSLYSTKDGYSFDNTINSKILAFAFGLVAEIEHNLISARTREALAARRDAGMVLGRPFGTSPKMEFLHENRDKIQKMVDDGDSVVAIHRRFGVSRGLMTKFLKTEYALNL